MNRNENPFKCKMAVHLVYVVKLSIPHVSHSNGFSPLWILWWLCNVDSSLKARPQIEQLCGRSFVWYDKCRWYDCWNVNVLLHSSHVYGISPVKKISEQQKKILKTVITKWRTTISRNAFTKNDIVKQIGGQFSYPYASVCVFLKSIWS